MARRTYSSKALLRPNIIAGFKGELFYTSDNSTLWIAEATNSLNDWAIVNRHSDAEIIQLINSRIAAINAGESTQTSYDFLQKIHDDLEPFSEPRAISSSIRLDLNGTPSHTFTGLETAPYTVPVLSNVPFPKGGLGNLNPKEALNFEWMGSLVYNIDNEEPQSPFRAYEFLMTAKLTLNYRDVFSDDTGQGRDDEEVTSSDTFSYHYAVSINSNKANTLLLGAIFKDSLIAAQLGAILNAENRRSEITTYSVDLNFELLGDSFKYKTIVQEQSRVNSTYLIAPIIHNDTIVVHDDGTEDGTPITAALRSSGTLNLDFRHQRFEISQATASPGQDGADGPPAPVYPPPKDGKDCVPTSSLFVKFDDTEKVAIGESQRGQNYIDHTIDIPQNFFDLTDHLSDDKAPIRFDFKANYEALNSVIGTVDVDVSFNDKDGNEITAGNYSSTFVIGDNPRSVTGSKEFSVNVPVGAKQIKIVIPPNTNIFNATNDSFTPFLSDQTLLIDLLAKVEVTPSGLQSTYIDGRQETEALTQGDENVDFSLAQTIPSGELQVLTYPSPIRAILSSHHIDANILPLIQSGIGNLAATIEWTDNALLAAATVSVGFLAGSTSLGQMSKSITTEGAAGSVDVDFVIPKNATQYTMEVSYGQVDSTQNNGDLARFKIASGLIGLKSVKSLNRIEDTDGSSLRVNPVAGDSTSLKMERHTNLPLVGQLPVDSDGKDVFTGYEKEGTIHVTERSSQGTIGNYKKGDSLDVPYNGTDTYPAENPNSDGIGANHLSSSGGNFGSIDNTEALGDWSYENTSGDENRVLGIYIRNSYADTRSSLKIGFASDGIDFPNSPYTMTRSGITKTFNGQTFTYFSNSSIPTGSGLRTIQQQIATNPKVSITLFNADDTPLNFKQSQRWLEESVLGTARRLEKLPDGLKLQPSALENPLGIMSGTGPPPAVPEGINVLQKPQMYIQHLPNGSVRQWIYGRPITQDAASQPARNKVKLRLRHADAGRVGIIFDDNFDNNDVNDPSRFVKEATVTYNRWELVVDTARFTDSHIAMKINLLNADETLEGRNSGANKILHKETGSRHAFDSRDGNSYQDFVVWANPNNYSSEWRNPTTDWEIYSRQLIELELFSVTYDTNGVASFTPYLFQPEAELITTPAKWLAFDPVSPQPS